MSAMESLLQASPEVGEALIELMSECDGLREFGRRVLALSANALMSAEADAACGAALGERSGSRVNSRNGYRRRGLKTPLGDVELEVPKLRRGTYYPETLLARWSRVDASLAALVVEAYANGVSTRGMALLASELGVSGVSSSEVSRLARSLDAQVDELRGRDLGGQRYCYLWVDATYVRCRVDGRSVSQAVVTAIALGEDGYKHLVGLDCVDTESYESWRAFLASIRARGLSGLVLCVSDAHAGLARALSEVFQGAAWQRCTVHLQRSMSAAAGRGGERLVRELGKALFSEGDALVARATLPRAVAAMRGAGEGRAADLLESAAPDALQYLSLPAEHWRRVRTNNVQERANRELKRRYRSVQAFPSRESLLRLLGAVMLEEEAAWASTGSSRPRRSRGPGTRPRRPRRTGRSPAPSPTPTGGPRRRWRPLLTATPRRGSIRGGARARRPGVQGPGRRILLHHKSARDLAWSADGRPARSREGEPTTPCGLGPIGPPGTRGEFAGLRCHIS